MMTLKEKQYKKLIERILNEEGYPTYANIFHAFDLNTTANPKVVGFMKPGQGVIVVNHNLDKDQVSVIIRHEILHEYLSHSKRMLQKLNAKSDRLQDYLNNVDGLSLRDLEKIGYNKKSTDYNNYPIHNVAGDLEISNLGYTEEDKENVRKIKLNGQELSGLVTEDKHPEWVTYSFEELVDALNEEEEKIKQEMNNQPPESPQQPQQPDDEDSDDENEDGQNGSDENDSDDQNDFDDSDENDSDGENSDKNDSDDENENDSDEKDYGDGETVDDSEAEYVYGELIDDDTFVDENGNNW